MQNKSFRLDGDLEPLVEKWLKKHSSLTLSRLANMAIRRFVLEDQQLESVEVETVIASPKKVRSSFKKMMKEHKHAMDKLK